MCWRQIQHYFSIGARTGEECLSDWLTRKMCWGACYCTPQKLGHRPCGCRSGRQGVMCSELKRCCRPFMAAGSEVKEPSQGGCCLPAERAGIS